MKAYLGFLAVLLMATLAWGQGKPLPTQDQLHEMLEQRQYRLLLQQIARVQSLKPELAKAYDGYDLLMLKGEALLRTRNTVSAIEAFAAAAKEAGNEQKAALATATSILVKRARNGLYTPSHGEARSPVGILDPEQRKAAMTALFNDDRAAAMPQITAGQTSDSMPPILNALGLLPNLRLLELAATGTNVAVPQATASLTERASKLMDDALEKMSQRVEEISRSAEQPVEVVDPPAKDGKPSPVPRRRWKKRGPSPQEARELRDIIATCQKLPQAAQELAAASSADSALFASASERAQALGRRAIDVLYADYSSSERQ